MNDNSQHPDREYLGDSVYVDYNSARQIVLELDNGMGIHTTIVLEPEVFDELVNYVERIQNKYRGK